MRLRTALATAVAGLALAAPAAQADDASLAAAYVSHHDEVDAANAAWREADKAAAKGDATTAEIRALIAANKQVNAVSALIRGEVAAQEPSTENGAKAKTLALREIDLLVRANEYEIRADRHAIRRRWESAKAWFKKSDRVYRQYQRTSRRAVRAFHAAGQDVPKSGAGAPS